MASDSHLDPSDTLPSGLSLPGPDSDEVGKLLAALRSPLASDGAREQEAVAAIAAAVRAAPTSLDTRRKRMSVRSAPAKIAAVGAAVLLFGGTAAAAATGSLPGPAQHAVSAALSHVSVDVPDGDGDADGAAAERDVKDTPVGVDPTGPAKHGLCTAWAARNRDDADRGESANSTAFANLRHAAHDQGMPVEEFCADELADDPAGPGAPHDGDQGQAGEDHGQADPGQTGEDHGQAGDHGAPADTPPASTPNAGGVGSGGDTSGGGNDPGTHGAQDPAGGGSGNGEPHSAPTTPER